jgi:hypothetical protein
MAEQTQEIARIAVPALDAILGKDFRVLDSGFFASWTIWAATMPLSKQPVFLTVEARSAFATIEG